MKTHTVINADGSTRIIGTVLDCLKDGPRTEMIRGLIEHAKDDIRLAELTASENALWHLAEECRNLQIVIEKLTSSKLEGE